MWPFKRKIEPNDVPAVLPGLDNYVAMFDLAVATEEQRRAEERRTRIELWAPLTQVLRKLKRDRCPSLEWNLGDPPSFSYKHRLYYLAHRPSATESKKWLCMYDGVIRMVTAAEGDTIEDMIEQLIQHLAQR